MSQEIEVTSSFLLKHLDEYIKKLEKVVEAAREVLLSDGYHYLDELSAALKELD